MDPEVASALARHAQLIERASAMRVEEARGATLSKSLLFTPGELSGFDLDMAKIVARRLKSAEVPRETWEPPAERAYRIYYEDRSTTWLREYHRALLDSESFFRGLSSTPQKQANYSIFVGSGANIAIGDHNSQHVEQQTLPKGFDSLAADLHVLLPELRRRASESGHDKSVVAVGEAEAAASRGDPHGAFRFLSSAGKWALGIAREVGAKVASAWLESAIGIK